MSWDINIDIYRKNNSNWECVAHDKNFNILKNISDVRGSFLSDGISEAFLNKEDKAVINDIMKQFNPTVYDFVGSFTKEVFSNLDVKTRFEIWEDGEGLVVSEKDAERIKPFDVSFEEYVKIPEEERKKLISIYSSHIEKRGYGRGSFYRADGFESYLAKKIEEYNKLIEKRFRLESLLYSVEYMKLEEEEQETAKENIDENYENINENINEVKYQIEATQSALAILDFFNDGDDVVMYVYGL